MPRGVGRQILFTMRKSITLYALLGLMALPVSAQKDKNYFTQVLHMSDGTEMRILADDIRSISAIRTDDFKNMTAWEFIKFAKADIDSASMAYKSIYPNDLSAPYTSLSSQYTVKVPNNSLWRTAFPLMQTYGHRTESIVGFDIKNFTSATDTKTIIERVSPDEAAASLLLALSGEAADKYIERTQEVCNGTVGIIAQLPKESWLTEMTIGAENGIENQMKLFPAAAELKLETTKTSMKYAHFIPGGERYKPDILINLPKPFATTYDFYCVVVPENPSIVEDVTETRPNWLNFQMTFCDRNGKRATYSFSKAYADSLQTGGTLPAVPTTVNKTTAFTNDTSKIETIYIGRFTFPVAYAGSTISPTLRITSPISVVLTQELNTYTRDVRLAAIIMRPVELNEQASH